MRRLTLRPPTDRAPAPETAEDRAALSAVTALQEDRAPAALRIRIQLMATLAQRQRAAARRRAFAKAAAVLTAAAVAVPLLLLTGPEPAPSVADALVPAHSPAVARIAQPSDGQLTLPRVTGAGLAFPYWADRFGWQATGIRWDRLDGRTLTTVLYARGQRSLAYTIVSGAPLSAPARARIAVRNGTRLSSLSLAGRTVVTWLRRGHTCVLSGWDVPGNELVALGSWRAHGAIPY